MMKLHKIGLIVAALALGAVATPAEAAKVRTRLVRVESTPPGATVFLDDETAEPLCVTPARRVRVPYGFHELIFKLGGHRTERVKVNVGAKTWVVKTELAALARIEISAADATAQSATVTVDGTDLGSVPFVGELEPGRHQIVIRKPGHRAFSQWIDLKGGQVLSLPVLLVPDATPKGTLFVTADVPGAIVVVDGEPRGAAPLSIDLPPGPALVEVRTLDHPPWRRTVQVTAGGKAIVEAHVRPDTGPSGTALVLSNVSGTVVWVDGTRTGTAPATITGLVKGTHIIEGKAEGYKPAQTTVRIEPDEQTVVKLSLEPIEAEFGRISVRASVPGAKVYVDGGEQGPAPVEMEQVPLGPHAIVVRRDGYADYEASCEVKRNQLCNVMASLVPLAKVAVTASAPGARLFIDGREMGPLPFEGTVTAGKHRFRVEARSHRPEELEVELQASADVRNLSFTLESDGSSREELAKREETEKAERAKDYQGASAYSGVPLGPGQNAFDIAIGLPHLVELRGTVGVLDALAFGVSIRALERDLELGTIDLVLRAHTGARLLPAVSVGAQAEAFAGTDFAAISSFGGTLSGLLSLHFADRGTFTLGVVGEVLRDEWKNKPSIAADGNQSAARVRANATVLYWMDSVAVFGSLDYKVAGVDRLLFKELLFGSLNQDPKLYLRGGISIPF